TYTLHEEYAPDGYVIATDVEFTVTEEKVNQEMTLINKQVTVSKEDISGEEIEGATLEVIDEDGNVVDKWTSDGSDHAITGLEEGKTYTLVETSAPTGYYYAESIEFTVTGIDEDGVKVCQHLTMVDEQILTDIQVNKVDSDSGELIKSKDFEFGLYSDEECKNLITSVHANTDEGIATFSDLAYGTYYIKEISAPNGYQLSDEIIKVVVDDDLENVGKTYSFEYSNTLLPSVYVKTGDDTNALNYAIAASVAGVLLAGTYIEMKKRKEEE
ncbi:MAG: hypothetical protein LUG60_06105, partial [Erysipelotrichaceae bacterium]|nr:hypothetical protein [Erysipelotrichaceae bacterium]